jgi:hypothetical protein
MKEKVICPIQTQSPHIILLFVFISPTEHCDLENLGSHLARSRYGHPNFLEKGKLVQIFAYVK